MWLETGVARAFSEGQEKDPKIGVRQDSGSYLASQVSHFQKTHMFWHLLPGVRCRSRGG